jgi:hypothetical protein
VSLIDNQMVTAEDGERILKLLLWPRIITRNSYPIGEIPFIGVECPFKIRFRRTSLLPYMFLNRIRGYDSGSFLALQSTPSYALLPYRTVPESVGKYKIDIKYDYMGNRSISYWPPFIRRLLSRITRGDNWISYTCNFSVPVEIIVADDGEAEKIEFVTNPELDEAMAAAFTSKPLETSYEYGKKGERLKAMGGITLSCNDVPTDIAFRRVLELPNGTQLMERYDDADEHIIFNAGVKTLFFYSHPDSIRLRAGSSGSFTVYGVHFPDNFHIDKPGQYDCTVILIPDANIAYDDPAIKSIWNGELRFPMSVTIKREE